MNTQCVTTRLKNVSLLSLNRLCVAALSLMWTGCSQLIDSKVPEPIRPFVEPEFGSDYQLYRPLAYDRAQSWPLIVVCHSAFPDSPNRQLREWTQLAEAHGFIVVAPHLTRAKRKLQRDFANEKTVVESNEARILSVIRHVRAAHGISTDRILIYGWGKGASAALYAGLRNPELFRAVAVTEPRLADDMLPGSWNDIDHYQPIQIHYNIVDAMFGKPAHNCAAWLRSVGANVYENSTGTARRTDAKDSIEFFQRIIRKHPWLHIRAFTAAGDTPLAAQFKTASSFTPKRFHWEFGDGDESVVAQPIHVYQKAGRYRVTLIVPNADGTDVKRTVELNVPGLPRR